MTTTLDPDLLKVYKGAPYAPPGFECDHLRKTLKRAIHPRGFRINRDQVPTGLIHPSARTCPDDGVSRNWWAMLALRPSETQRTKVVREVVEASQGLCTACDARLRKGQWALCDVWPRAHGGIYSPQNLVATCGICRAERADDRTTNVWDMRALVRVRRNMTADTPATIELLRDRVKHLHPHLV